MLPAPVSPDYGHRPRGVMRPGFGGMLRSRRQGHASFASVSGADGFPLPGELRLPAAGGPLSIRRGVLKALLDAYSNRSDFKKMLSHPSPSEAFRPLARTSARRLHHLLRGALARHRVPCETLCPKLRHRLRGTSARPIHRGIPSRLPIAARGRPSSVEPCKPLVLLWFPSAFPSSYSYETVINPSA